MKKSFIKRRFLCKIVKISLSQIALILLFSSITLAMPVRAQEILDTKVSVTLSNVSLENSLTELEKSAQVKFSYNSRALKLSQKVSVVANKEALSSVLDRLLKPLNIQYFQVSNRIVLRKNDERSLTINSETDPSMNLNGAALAEITVKGTVIDEKGEKLPGVNISVKGTTRGVTTNVNGEFSIDLPNAKSILLFSFVGFLSQEIVVGSNNIINVTLIQDSKSLEEVVVVGYGTQKKVNLTGSVASIDQKFLANRPITNSSQALQGLAGVYVNMSKGRPGADGATIRIRGVGSFGTNNNPLVLVDGVEYNLRDINPADIESITVLKDAASSAIYGNRAANGVVLVKTRGGEKGKFRIDYNMYTGFQEATILPDVVSNAVQYMEGKNLALKNQGSPIEYSQAIIDEYKAGTDPYVYANTNWFDVMFRRALQQEHNLRFSGGNERTTFALSLGYLNQDGIMLGSGAKRYSINSNIASDVTKWLKIGGNINANFWDYKESAYTSDEGNGEGGLMGLIYRGLPMQVPLLADGSYADQWIRVPGHNFFRNPYALANEGFRKNTNFSAIFNFFAEAQLAKNLRYKVTIAPNFGYDLEKFNNPVIDLRHPKTGLVAPMGNIPIRGVRQGLSEALSFTNFHTINWDKTIGKSEFAALGGFSLEMFRNGSFNAGNQGYFANEISELSAGSANPVVGGNSTQSRLMSYFGRVNYVFNNKYLLETNFRFDGSSRFAPDKRWGFFPSVSAGWRINEEEFFKDIRQISNLKFRASWGQLGSQPQQLFGFIETISSGLNYNYNNTVVSGGGVTQIAERNLTWETTTMTDIGLDFGFFNQRLTGEFDWFNKITSGILRQVNIPQQVGNLTGPVQNLGSVQNKGIEFTLNWRDKIGDLSYNLGGNILQLSNNVLSTGGQRIFNGNRVIFEGYPIDSYFGLHSMGYFQSIDEIKAAPFQNAVTLPGDIRYIDLNGDNKIDNNDRDVIGNTIPQYTYSFTVGVDYKGFDFSALMQGVQGLQNYVNSNLGFPYRNGAGVIKEFLTESWTVDNPNAKYPRLTTANGYPQNFQVSNFWMQDASYLRLKNIQLGYTIPDKVAKKLGMNKLRAFVNGQNLLTFADFTLGDPERNAANENIIAFPISKVVSAGLSVTF